MKTLIAFIAIALSIFVPVKFAAGTDIVSVPVVIGVGGEAVITLRGTNKQALEVRRDVILDRLRWALNDRKNIITFSANEDGSQSIFVRPTGTRERLLLLTVTSSDCLYQKMDTPTLTSHWAIALARAVDELSASS